MSITITASVVTNGDGHFWHEYDNTPQWLRTTGSANSGPNSAVPESGFEGATVNATDWYDGGASFNGLARFILVFNTSVLAGYTWNSAKLVMVPSETFPANEETHLVNATGVSATVRALTDGDINYYGSRPMVPGDSAGYIIPATINQPSTSTTINEIKIPINTSGNTFIGCVAKADVNNTVVYYQNVVHWYSSGHPNSAYHPYLLIEGEATIRRPRAKIYLRTGSQIITL